MSGSANQLDIPLTIPPQFYEFYSSIPVLAFDGVVLLFTLAVTIYCWQDTIGGHHERRFPIFRGDNAIIRWDDRTAFDPISWNCELYPIIQGPRGKVRTLCKDGE